MGINSADPDFTRTMRQQPGRASLNALHRRASRPRMPSTSGYMAAAGATAAALFFVLWWMLHSSGDEAPWVPAGLAASVVMLVAAAAREVVMRRAWTRYILEQGKTDHVDKGARKHHSSSSSSSSSSSRASLGSHSAALRSLNKQSAEADVLGALPEAHLDVYHACKEFLASTDEALRTTNAIDRRIALRAGQEQVRVMQKHHLLTWARSSSRALTHEAQRRVAVSDKIETAMRALDVIDAALKVYPNEPELRESELAVREFIASVKVGHWVEMAERAAFKQQYARAIDRYRDALFYLSRETMKEESRAETASRIGREIELLRVRLKMEDGNSTAHASRKQRRESTTR